VGVVGDDVLGYRRVLLGGGRVVDRHRRVVDRADGDGEGGGVGVEAAVGGLVGDGEAVGVDVAVVEVGAGGEVDGAPVGVEAGGAVGGRERARLDRQLRVGVVHVGVVVDDVLGYRRVLLGGGRV